MTPRNALDLLRRHAPLAFGWCDVVAGYDFGFLTIRDIQEWVRSLCVRGPEAERLAGLEGAGLLRFEETLWSACTEGVGGKVPRPGHVRWAQAQDLWRLALLKEALAAPESESDFAAAVETTIDHVGCPEDMLGLLSWGPGRVPVAHRGRVEAFVRALELRYRPEDEGWITLAAS